MALAVGVSGGCEDRLAASRGGGDRPDTGRLSAGAGGTAVVEPEIPAPSAGNPVTVGAWVRPGVLAPGGVGELVVRLRVAGGHHLYAGGAAGGMTGTSVRMEEGGVVRAAGDWMGPAAGADGFLTGLVEFRRVVRVAEGAAAGKGEVGCAVTFQACTDELCWPPRTIEVRAGFFVAGPR